MQKMTKIYFSQTEIYYSESKDSMLKIQDMDPTHAGNAARRLLQDSQGWAQDAGCTGHAHASWMLSTPLWNALYQRAARSAT